MASLVFSLIGFFYLKHGKRVTDMKFAMAGILLVIFGYFTPTIAWTIGIGVLLCAVPFIPRVGSGT